MEYVHKTLADITIDQFNCWGDWSLNGEFNHGEYEIYQIPDLHDYDGVIVDINNIAHLRVLNGLLDRIRESGLPAVSLCNDVDGLYYAGINGRKAITEIIDHLYHVHGCRSFFFAGGPKGNYENEERASAFRDSMNRLGLPEYSDQIVYSDFDAGGGHECMKYLLEHHIPIPDAIVCANDNIAVGLIGEAEDHGYQVPRDFLVTGFDYFDKAAWFEPQLTTAVLHRESIGALAIQVLEKCWAGESCPHYNYTTARLIFTESCGCPNSGSIDYRGYVRGQVLGIIKGQDNDAEIARLEYDLTEADNTKSFAQRVAEEYGNMDCDGCTVFMDSRVLDPAPEMLSSRTAYTYDSSENCAVVSVGKEACAPDGVSVAQYLAHRQKADRGTVYYHIPLHIGSITAGTIALKNPRFLLIHFDIFEIQEAILFVLQSQYQNARLKSALSVLQSIYDRDPMTGVYNRTAFDERLVPVYRRWIEGKQTVAVIFVDVDNFKKINDSHGHAYGDEVLKTVAHTMQEFLPEKGFVCRYGGDEFLAVFPYEKTEEILDYWRRVEKHMSSSQISLSAGIRKASGGTLEENVQAADRAMYRVKEQHHKGRT